MMWVSSPGRTGKEAALNNARSSCFEYHLWVSLFKRRHHPLADAITIFRTDFTYARHRHRPRGAVHFHRTPGLFGLIGHYWKSSAAVAARHERASTRQTGTRTIIIIIIIIIRWRIILLLLLLCARVLYT